jgi:hypothetical protein
MPNFDLVVGYGLSVADWNDPRALVGGVPSGPPSRLNPRPGVPEKRLLATVGVECEIRAVVYIDGEGWVEGPADIVIEPNLFFAASVEAPHPWQVPFTHPTDEGIVWSSKQRFTLTQEGHHLIYMRRRGGGQIMVHIDAAEGT